MSYRITWQDRPNGQGLDGRIAVLEDGQGAGLEVWPALGFNAVRWHIGTTELLYADPQLFENGRPTRSGIPILFPFPNRLRAGTFTYDGKTYHLPLNDPAKANAIHGFACRHPWRVLDASVNDDSASITGEFDLRRDAPADAPLWPANAVLRITYRLLARRLVIAAEVSPDAARPLPFGLGYHPYFSLAPFGGETALVQVPASQFWELDASLPTGVKQPVAGQRDLRAGKPVAELHLDDVLTGLPDLGPGLHRLGSIRHPDGGPALHLHAEPAFRELVVFTPPHRQAFCLEPYTCTTDAIHRDDGGWQVLTGQPWQGRIELVFEPKGQS